MPAWLALELAAAGRRNRQSSTPKKVQNASAPTVPAQAAANMTAWLLVAMAPNPNAAK